MRAAHAAAAVAMAVGPGCAPSGPAAPPLDDVAEAWFHPSADREPPADDDPLWRRVELPDFWGIGRRSRAREGWYRITFTAHPDQPWAASVEGDWSALDVFLNGRAQLHAHEQFGDLLPSEPPLLVLMPAHELEPGDNQLLLRFETALWRIGSLGPLLIGPTEHVHAQRERRYLRQSVLPTSITWFALACGAILALLARWEETRSTGWFAAGTAAWCIPLLEPTRSLIAVGHALPSSVLLHAFPPLFTIGFHRVLRLQRPGVERVLLGSIALGALVRALVPPLLIPTVDWSWWVVDIGIALYLLQLALRTRRTGALPYASGALLLAAALAVAAGIHDVSSLLARRPLLGFAFTPYVPAVLGLATVAALVSALGKRLA
ncbi:MAG TPA: hypothetical protein VIN04_03780, partial [Myxococcota bacterium]